MAIERIEPFGEVQMDRRFGILGAHLINVQLGKKGNVKPEDIIYIFNPGNAGGDTAADRKRNKAAQGAKLMHSLMALARQNEKADEDASEATGGAGGQG